MIRGIIATLAFLAGLLIDRGSLHVRSSVTDVDGHIASVAGIETAFQEKHIVKLLLVHGMGPHEAHETRPYTNQIAKKLGFNPVSDKDTQAFMPPPPLPAGAEPAELYERTYTRKNPAAPGGVDVLIAYEIRWAPLIDGIKHRALAQDADYDSTRVKGNALLKRTLMNDRLADPVMYLGDMGVYIRNAIKFATCRMTNGVFDQTHVGKETCSHVHDDNAAIAIITWSLGSRITYDALNELVHDESSGEAPKLVLRETFNVYMLANQLPLLQLSHLPPASGECEVPTQNSLRDLLLLTKDLKVTRTLSPALPFTVIAVSDPNDLLSYPIPKSFAEEIACKDARFVNVITEIARPFALGMFANPLKAHTGQMDNPFIVRLLEYGYSKR